jgi:hypothetical protein
LGTTSTQNGFNIWRTSFGSATGSGAGLSQPSQATIPEPASLLVAFLAWTALAIKSRSMVDRM